MGTLCIAQSAEGDDVSISTATQLELEKLREEAKLSALEKEIAKQQAEAVDMERAVAAQQLEAAMAEIQRL